MADYVELVKRLHKRIALTTAGSPLQDDLQDSDDAIEELLGEVERAENRHVVESEMIDEMYAEIERLKAKVPTWISVEERLPKIDDYGYSKDVYVTDGEYVEHAFLYKAGDELFWSCAAEIDIFFWCDGLYMPAPPKERCT